MSFNVELFFESNFDLGQIFDIKIDTSKIEYSIAANKIKINSNAYGFGFHLLRLKTLQPLAADQYIKFTSVLVNGADIKQNLYLAFSDVNGVITGNTILSHRTDNWTLPFGNPVSWWLVECATTIKDKDFSQDLYKDNRIYYPESVTLDESYPKVLQDFFKYNFGFLIHDKSELDTPFNKSTVPYAPLKNFKYDHDGLLAELLDNIEMFQTSEYKPVQTTYTLDENKNKISLPWQILGYKIGASPEFLTHLPNVTKLIKQVENDGVTVLVAFLSAVHPKSVVHIHSDKSLIPNIDKQYKSGCCEIYIPLGWDDNSYFKLDKVGLIPHDDGAYIVNNTDVYHATINNSDKPRFTIGLMCEFPDNFNKYL